MFILKLVDEAVGSELFFTSSLNSSVASFLPREIPEATHATEFFSACSRAVRPVPGFTAMLLALPRGPSGRVRSGCPVELKME